ncbi:MAG: hypothetical protein HY718_19010, partial [Planctomycetes bacterium]|nr:hypothetical protein [Planctomycetota bacterium]
MRRLKRGLLAMTAAGVLCFVGYRLDVWPYLRSPRGPRIMSVAETFQQLRQWRQQGAYGAMEPYLQPAAREATIDLLLAVDELMTANRAALQAVRQACPDIDTSRFDLTVILDSLDLFSRRVELVRCEEMGNTAAAIAEVSGRLPLVEMHFERHDGRWVYVPGTENRNVVDLIRNMTRSLGQIALVLSGRPATAEEVDYEYRLRLAPKLTRMRQQPGTPPPAQDRPQR